MKNDRSPETVLLTKTLLLVGFSFLFFLIINLLYIHWASYHDVKESLKQTSDRIAADLVLKNAGWDTSTYVNDNTLPQNLPIYLFSTYGFIIDRENPISGFLDTSNFQTSSSFILPSTVVTPANESWRLYSRPIIKNNNVVGVVTVGYYQPEESALPQIDANLLSTAEALAAKVGITDKGLDAKSIDERSVSIKLSFEIVDTFNRTVKSVGGLPSYIDQSYLADLQRQQFKSVIDTVTGDSYLVSVRPLYDDNKVIAGVLVNGYPLRDVQRNFRNQLIFSVGSGLLVVILLIIALGYLIRKELRRLIQETREMVQNILPISTKGMGLVFDKDMGIISLGDKKLDVPIRTKQYYICKVLFSKPNKTWENDEIIDKLPPEAIEIEAGDTYEFDPGDNTDQKRARMIYDAIRSLNEKGKPLFGSDVILLRGGTYRVNPSIQPQTA